MLNDPIAMIEDLGITIRTGGATTANYKASNTNDFSIEDRWTTGVTIAGTIAGFVCQTEHVVSIDSDGEATAALRYGAECVPLQSAWHIATGDKATPAGDNHRAAGGCLVRGQWYGLYLVGEDQGSFQMQQGHIVPEASVILMHLNLFHIDQDAAAEAIQGASTNAQNTGRGTIKGRGMKLLLSRATVENFLVNLHVQCAITQLGTDAVRCSEDDIS